MPGNVVSQSQYNRDQFLPIEVGHTKDINLTRGATRRYETISVNHAVEI